MLSVGWSGAGVVHTAEGHFFTSVSIDTANASAVLCIETGAMLEAHKFNEKVTHCMCLVRENENAPYKVLSPCGIFEKEIRMKKIVISIVLILVIIIFSILIASPIVNDNVAKKTASELVELPLPDNTEFIEAVYQAGKLIGNGNGMQYFGGILIKSELSLEELKAYYSQFAKKEWECIVERQTDAEIKVLEHAKLTCTADIKGDQYYIVYSWGDNPTIFHELDIRGH